MQDTKQIVQDNISRLREEIAVHANGVGRSEDDITLVAVCKYVDSEITEQVVRGGCLDIGENRPQTLWAKAAELSDLGIRFHQIGHLQRNKVRRTISSIALLHAGDSLRLLQSVCQESQKQGIVTNVLLEVNISGDESKHGFAPAEMTRVVDEVAQMDSIKVCGLMGMAGLESDTNQSHMEYAVLRDLRDGLNSSCTDKIKLDELSMGMSRDFGIAIQEGATIVRVGAALFQGLQR